MHLYLPAFDCVAFFMFCASVFNWSHLNILFKLKMALYFFGKWMDKWGLKIDWWLRKLVNDWLTEGKINNVTYIYHLRLKVFMGPMNANVAFVGPQILLCKMLMFRCWSLFYMYIHTLNNMKPHYHKSISVSHTENQIV